MKAIPVTSTGLGISNSSTSEVSDVISLWSELEVRDLILLNERDSGVEIATSDWLTGVREAGFGDLGAINLDFCEKSIEVYPKSFEDNVPKDSNGRLSRPCQQPHSPKEHFNAHLCVRFEATNFVLEDLLGSESNGCLALSKNDGVRRGGGVEFMSKGSKPLAVAVGWGGSRTLNEKALHKLKSPSEWGIVWKIPSYTDCRSFVDSSVSDEESWSGTGQCLLSSEDGKLWVSFGPGDGAQGRKIRRLGTINTGECEEEKPRSRLRGGGQMIVSDALLEAFSSSSCHNICSFAFITTSSRPFLFSRRIRSTNSCCPRWNGCCTSSGSVAWLESEVSSSLLETVEFNSRDGGTRSLEECGSGGTPPASEQRSITCANEILFFAFWCLDLGFRHWCSSSDVDSIGIVSAW